MHIRRQRGPWLHHGAGMDAGLGPGPGVELIEGLGEAQTRIGQGHPGQTTDAGLLLQSLGIVAAGGQQQGAGASGREAGRQGAAGLQEAQLPG